MDDLSGLTWSSTSNQGQKPSSNLNSINLPNNASSYSSFRATPSPFSSGRQTPLSQTNAGPTSKPANITASAPGQDSFSNLMSFAKGSTSSSTANLSLRERQELLEAEKRRKEAEKRKLAESQFNFDQLAARGTTPNASSAFPKPSYNSGASGASTPSFGMPVVPPPFSASLSTSSTQPSKASFNDDDDLFAAFNAETKVDNASHYPPPAKTPVSQSTGLDLSNPTNWAATTTSTGAPINNTDDDPFGISSFKTTSSSAAPAVPATSTDDVDFLGDLARPVEQVRREQEEKRLAEEAARAKERKPAPKSRHRPAAPIDESDSSSEQEQGSRKTGNPAFDKAIDQLMAYGFDEKTAVRGLTASGAGTNVQAAANWLLDEAHRKAKEKAQGKSGQSRSHSQSQDQQPSRRPPKQESKNGEGSAAWMNNAAGGEDLSKTVAAVSGQIFKTANSFWKTSQKKVQKAMAEFNQELPPGGDPSQPKWMREAQVHSERASSATTTDEAMMLESDGRMGGKGGSSGRPSASAPRERPSASPSGVPKWQQHAPKSTNSDPRARLGKLAKEDDDLSSYVSPNRRKGRTQQPSSEPPKPSPPSIEGDLLGGSSSVAPRPQQRQALPQRPAPQKSASPQPQAPTGQRSTPRPAARPAPKARQIPAVSPAALQSSTQHRLQGTAHFKRGDYASAHEAYSISLSSLPSTHPLTIVLLTNRALTSLKNGEPKNAIKDADDALQLIGPSCGQDEIVMVHTETGNEEKRNMKDLFGKALSRKAEALEQMERWSDAGSVWQQCVEAGVGGPTAIAGRQRCQKAIAPKPAPRPPAAVVKPKPRPTAAKSPANGNSEAVERLRKANEAAAQEDDEKFALAEKVDARIAAWRDGKRDNLRALIGSLDKVLWENSGWKKVGLHELVLANKVKVSYMKAIAKTHPDKIPQDASTEVRLIAATVFATLNESWDKFKAENGL
ncbi:UBA domain-containing protein 7 [Ceratocystis fimbriata CBS 114723]|uniref:UBA domain-containing protein 7 n=1 Tax=Ceratocystis fimbriata CBS 114723 TaxID=1035309 RepID=A0A2C5WZZ3_9PEZI|nr:UBA domain-containing protein 7 [Ceratocystis fimbriata CBS 114723]